MASKVQIRQDLIASKKKLQDWIDKLGEVQNLALSISGLTYLQIDEVIYEMQRSIDRIEKELRE